LVTGLVLSALVACTSGGISNDDCGANACGACQSGFVNSDRCVDGEWECDCVPRTGQESSSTTPTADGGNDASPDAPQVLTCEQKLTNPSATGVCPADERDQPCERGCLSCRCLGGTWGACTTSASCFDGGGG
jgi:hypothetical protein